MAEARQQQKRFIPRYPKRNLPLNDTHIEVLFFLHHFRALNAEQLSRLIDFSHTHVRDRVLLDLFNCGYAMRPPQPIQEKQVYMLATKGAQALQERGMYFGRLDRTHRANRTISPKHLSLEAETLAQFYVSAREKGVRFLFADEILAHSSLDLQSQRDPFKFPVAFRHNGTTLRRQVNADGWGMYGFELPDGKKVYFFLEADRGTEPINPKNLRRSSIAQKLLAYHTAFEQGVLEQRYGIRSAIIFFLIESRHQIKPQPEQRIAHIVEANDQLRIAKPRFFFAPKAALQHNIFDLPWTTNKGRPVVLSELFRL